jgi:hypothetical protein
MGKTSLLYNLTRLLPRTIVPLYVDLQQACTAANHTGFLHKLVKSFSASANLQRDLVLPTLPIEQLEADPFTCFDDWVDEVEKRLGDQTAILTMDELNALEIPFSEHRFSEHQVMGMLRHLIQHRPRFKVLLATSFSIEELDTWASYLINAEVVPISYLSEEESYRLIERPVKDFTLVYQPEAARRIYQLTRGHPHLLQALCSAIVELKNKQPLISRRLCSLADVESAVPGALRKATTHFLVIESEKMDELALDILYFLARFPVGSYIRRELLARESPQASGASLALLLRRDLIEQHEDGFRFQVELVHHWFAQSPRRRWRR